MSTLQAIETLYKGYRFRSRLEARWAVFFDALGIQYEYEKEGYQLGRARYLPDFWLPELERFIEIKGAEATPEEHEKALKLAQQSGHITYLFEGEIKIPGPEDYPPFAYRYQPCDKDYWHGAPTFLWSECPMCHKINIGGIVHGYGLPCFCMLEIGKAWGRFASCLQPHSSPWIYKWTHGVYEALGATFDTPRLVAAYTSARQARFECGERQA